MKPNIESSKICVMLEQANGSFGRERMLNGDSPATPRFSAAAAYVSTISFFFRVNTYSFLSAGCGKSILAYVS